MCAQAMLPLHRFTADIANVDLVGGMDLKDVHLCGLTVLLHFFADWALVVDERAARFLLDHDLGVVNQLTKILAYAVAEGMQLE